MAYETDKHGHEHVNGILTVDKQWGTASLMRLAETQECPKTYLHSLHEKLIRSEDTPARFTRS